MDNPKLLLGERELIEAFQALVKDYEELYDRVHPETPSQLAGENYAIKSEKENFIYIRRKQFEQALHLRRCAKSDISTVEEAIQSPWLMEHIKKLNSNNLQFNALRIAQYGLAMLMGFCLNGSRSYFAEDALVFVIALLLWLTANKFAKKYS